MRSLIPLLLLLPTVAWAGGRASAFQKDNKNGTNYWNANSALDGKLETAWMVPGESANKGEWLEIDIPQGEVDKLSIVSGYAKTDKTFKDYPRIKKARVDIYALDDDQNANQVGSSTIDLADQMAMQTIDLTDAKVAAGLFGGRVRITVLEVYEGEDYPNLGVSEVVVQMKEFDAKVKVASIDDDADPAKSAAMLDEDPKTFSKLAAGTTLSLTTPGFGVSSINFVPVKDYSRPKTVEITVGSVTTTTVLPEKAPDGGWALFPAFNGYTGGALGVITVKIVDTWPAKNAEIGGDELKARATNFEAL